ncbi:MAG: DUF6261 family protein, partial [Odoribacteraceae bacterium]|nr:DUF6261 family protein [Odoribacteraceae bacterium]
THLSRQGYADESTAIDDVIRDLGSAKHAACFATLGIDALFTLLVEANATFFALVQERLKEDAQRPTSATRVRATVERALRAMLARAAALVTLHGDDAAPELIEFVREYNTIAHHYRQALAVERGRHAAKQDDMLIFE